MDTSGKSVCLCLILNMWDSLAYERLVDRDAWGASCSQETAVVRRPVPLRYSRLASAT